MVPSLLAAAALVVWVYLIAGRGGFWLAAERDDGGPAPATWPAVTAVIPARDEAESVGQTIASLLQQDYPGAFSIVLVDDQSSDGTADVARQAAAASADRLTIVPGAALPAGWTGKLWAMKQGVDARNDRRARSICCLPTPISSTTATRSRASSRKRRRTGWCSIR